MKIEISIYTFVHQDGANTTRMITIQLLKTIRNSFQQFFQCL